MKRFLLVGLCLGCVYAAPPEGENGFIKRLDRDGDGKVALEEFAAHPKMERAEARDLEKAFARIDRDGDGYVDAAEAPKRGHHHRRHWEKRLKKWDADQDGSVTRTEFDLAHQKWPTPRRDKVFKKLDRNGDGVIDRRDRPSKREGDRLMASLDLDRDGRVTPDEWAAAPHLEKVPQERRERMFQRLDKNGDGVLSKEDRP